MILPEEAACHNDRQHYKDDESQMSPFHIHPSGCGKSLDRSRWSALNQHIFHNNKHKFINLKMFFFYYYLNFSAAKIDSSNFTFLINTQLNHFSLAWFELQREKKMKRNSLIMKRLIIKRNLSNCKNK